MKKYIALFLLFFLSSVSQVTLASEWRKICVDGTDSGAVKNSTWHKINMASSGGNSWKKIGGCVAPEPPIPPGPVEPTYTHILDTGPSFGPGGGCGVTAGMLLTEPAPYNYPRDPRFAGGLLTPSTINGSRVFGITDNCNKGFKIDYEWFADMKPTPLFKTLTIIGVGTYVWDVFWEGGAYVCYEPGVAGEDLVGYVCASTRLFHGAPQLKPYTRYYIKVTL